MYAVPMRPTSTLKGLVSSIIGCSATKRHTPVPEMSGYAPGPPRYSSRRNVTVESIVKSLAASKGPQEKTSSEASRSTAGLEEADPVPRPDDMFNCKEVRAGLF